MEKVLLRTNSYDNFIADFSSTLNRFCQKLDFTFTADGNYNFYVKKNNKTFLYFHFGGMEKRVDNIYLYINNQSVDYRFITRYDKCDINIGFQLSYIMLIGNSTIAFGDETLSPIPSFFISKTNEGNWVVIGDVGESQALPPQFGHMKIITENMNQTAIEYDLTSWGADGQMSALANIPIPASSNSEYFKDIYYFLSRESISTGRIKLNGNSYYSTGYFAILDDDSGQTTPVYPTKKGQIEPFNFYNKVGQFGEITEGFRVSSSEYDKSLINIKNISDKYLSFERSSNEVFAIGKPIHNDGWTTMLISCKANNGTEGDYNTSSVFVYSDFDKTKMGRYQNETGGQGIQYAAVSFTNYSTKVYTFNDTLAVDISESIGKDIYLTFHNCDTTFEIYGITFI